MGVEPARTFNLANSRRKEQPSGDEGANMDPCRTASQSDMFSSRWALWLLWVGPWVLIAVSGSAGDLARTAVWAFSFTVMGAACLVNARRCGRRHCFYTGPLFLMAGLSSLLYGSGVLPLGRHGWSWISGVALVGAVIACCGLEKLLGKYIGSSRPRS